MWEFQFLSRPGHARSCRMPYANTKVADQTVHLIVRYIHLLNPKFQQPPAVPFSLSFNGCDFLGVF